MNRFLWSRQIQRWLSGCGTSKRISASNRPVFRPVLEHLESRLVPTVFDNNVINTAALITDLQAAVDTTGPAGDTTVIDLQPGATYTLTAVNNFWYGPTGLPPIDSNVVIHGHGATITRDPNVGPFRLFYVSGGLELPAGELAMDNVTLSGGLAKGGDSNQGGGGLGAGGAVFNQGTLNLNAVTLMNNEAEGGSGGVFGLGGGGGGMGGDASAPATIGRGGGFGGELGGSFGGAGGVSSNAGGSGGGGFVTGANGDNGGTFSNSDFRGGRPGFGSSDGFHGGFGGDAAGSGGVIGGSGGSFGRGGQAPSANGGGGGGGIGGGGGPGGGFNVLGGGGGGGFGGGGGSGNGNNTSSGNFGGGEGGFGGGGGVSESGSSGGGSDFGGGFVDTGGVGGGGGAGLGGAIFNMGADSTHPESGLATLVNCTLTANSAQGGLGGAGATPGSGFGGALFNLNGQAILTNDTLAANNVGGAVGNGDDPAGGAVYNLAVLESATSTTPPASASLFLNNSILATSNGGNDLTSKALDFFSGITNVARVAGINNLVMSNGGGIVPGIIISTANPNLVGPANYGGLTPTMLPGAGSPVLGAGDPLVSPGIDQRGRSRSSAGPIDLGSVQVSTAPTTGGSSSAGPHAPTGSLMAFAFGFVNNQLDIFFVDQKGQVFDEAFTLNNFFTPNPGNAQFLNTDLVMRNMAGSDAAGYPTVLGDLLDNHNQDLLMITIPLSFMSPTALQDVIAALQASGA